MKHFRYVTKLVTISALILYIYNKYQGGLNMAKVTISTHNGSKVHQDHNMRNRKVTDKELHINKKGFFEIWENERVRDAYHRLFDKYVVDYNAKQKRSDRQIKDYYKTVKDHHSKHTCYEMIVGVYGEVNFDNSYEILKEFYASWKERNPNLELIGAYFHADEEGQPHVHLDYIPVAHGYTRGMEVQTGLVKALGEMGFEKEGRATAQIQWEARENKFLEEICIKHGLEVEHPREAERKHLETKKYKLTQQIKDLEKQKEEALKIPLVKKNTVVNRLVSAVFNPDNSITFEERQELIDNINKLSVENEKKNKFIAENEKALNEAERTLERVYKEKDKLEDYKSILDGLCDNLHIPEVELQRMLNEYIYMNNLVMKDKKKRAERIRELAPKKFREILQRNHEKSYKKQHEFDRSR